MSQDKSGLRESYLFDRATISDIQRAAEEGIYQIRGFGAKRSLPHFDDLVFRMLNPNTIETNLAKLVDNDGCVLKF